MSELMSATELFEILRPHIDFPSRLIAFTIMARIDAPVMLKCECWVESNPEDVSLAIKETHQYHIVRIDDDSD